MRLTKSINLNGSRFSQLGLFVLIQLLLIFDKDFSKFHLLGPLHLYDFLFALLTITASISFIRRSDKFWVPPINIIIGIAILYLIYSLLAGTGEIKFIIRQFALFGYLAFMWLIISSFINRDSHNYNIRFIMFISICSFIVQVAYLFYLWIFNESFLLFGRFNYYSQVSIIGFIVFGAYVLTSIKNKFYQIPLILLYLVVSTMLGHASIFLACFVLVCFHFILRSGPKFRILGTIILSFSLISFILFLPQFGNSTAQWRLNFWAASINEMVVDYYGILGHGFGSPYFPGEFVSTINPNEASQITKLKSDSVFVTPMHNGFITLGFHIGLIPALLIFLPLYKLLTYFSKQRFKTSDGTSDFLILALIGSMIWVGFNVVIELPHSSAFFWLIYFSAVYHFSNTATIKNIPA